MTAEQLISMAREAGLPMTLITESSAIRWSEIKRFAKLVAAAERRNAVRAERERILALLDDMQEQAGNLHNYYGFAANKIREKSNGVL